jgi:hypothetical protein
LSFWLAWKVTTRRAEMGFAGLGIAARTLRFLATLEIAETGQFDDVAFFQRQTNFVEERFDNVLRFALIQTHFFEQQFCQISFGEGGHTRGD